MFGSFDLCFAPKEIMYFYIFLSSSGVKIYSSVNLSD